MTLETTGILPVVFLLTGADFAHAIASEQSLQTVPIETTQPKKPHLIVAGCEPWPILPDRIPSVLALSPHSAFFMSRSSSNHIPSTASVADVYPSVAPPLASEASTSDFVLARLEQVAAVIDAESKCDIRKAPVLSIVIPAYNERKTILQIIELVRQLDVEKQIIVVDDGSTDGTREILAGLPASSDLEIFLHERNQGKGAALQTGFRLAEGQIVIVQDADLEYSPQDILTVIEPILQNKADVVYGSRYLENKHQNSSRLHRFGNWLLTRLSNWTHGQNLTDMETCYKAIRRSILQDIRIDQQRFGFEPEITAKLARRGEKILEVPVHYNARTWVEGKKIGVRDLVATLYCIFRYRFFA